MLTLFLFHPLPGKKKTQDECRVSCPLMKAEDWKYVGEGGKHALFSYQPLRDGRKNDHWIGKLLRLQKKFLALSPHVVDVSVSSNADIAIKPMNGNDNSQHEQSREIPYEDDPVKYMRQVVAPHLLYYVDLPEPLPVTWSFLCDLYHQTWNRAPFHHNEEITIPPSRRHGWIVKKDLQNKEFTTLKQTTILGLLLPNYRDRPCDASVLLGQPGRDVVTRPLQPDYKPFSIEIKPKAGYLSFSPLVDPESRTKYQQSRFVLLQKLYQQGQVQKNWTTAAGPASQDPAEHDSIHISSYDPLDLFSGIPQRVSKAVDALFDCPQNNLKIWSAHKLLLGYNGVGYVPNDWFEIQRHLLRSLCSNDDRTQSSENGSISKFLNTILTEIIVQEKLLGKLLELQKLDLVDADGAILLYQRLVNDFCRGSEECAQNLLDEAVVANMATEKDTMKSLRSTRPLSFQASPLAPPSDSTRILQFFQCVKEFKTCLEAAAPALPLQSTMDAARDAALDLIQTFHKEDCIYLLQNWLLSLAMNDVSFFVKLEVKEPPRVGSRRCAPIDCPFMCHIQSHQSYEQAGVLEVTCCKHGHSAGLIHYELKVIDCDQKPSKKLQNRCNKENAFKSQKAT